MYMRLIPSFSTALAALLALAANVAHSQDFPIISIPKTVISVGAQLALPSQIISDEGIFMIVWDITDSGGTGATLSGNTFRATDTGTAILTATLTSGIPVTNFSASAVHTAAIQADGSLWTWGDNWVGQLGVGTEFDYRDEPIRIASNLTWATVSAGGYWEANYANYWDPYNHYYYTIALTTDGALWAWGDNRDGQLGDGTTTSTNKPKQIISEGSDDWAIVTAGFSCTMAIKTNGTLWAWGNNWAGQLGDGSRGNTSVPVKIDSDIGWRAVAPGFAHTVALKTDGTLWAWGNNCCGAFGDGTLISTNAPLQIGEATNWVAVAAGGDGDFDGQYNGEGIRNYTVALKTDGTLWAWGDNRYGQLGDPTIIDSTKPNQIGLDTDWASISTTSVFVMASKTDGSLWSWGGNYEGQLGNGTTVHRPIPGRVINRTGITIFTEDHHTLRVIPAGTMLIIR